MIRYSAIQLKQSDIESPVLFVNNNMAAPAALTPEQVLVKINYAAINPSDFMVLRGTYILDKALPAVPGTVGVGTVIAAGRSLRSKMFVGFRVACAGNYTGDGTWSQYLIAPNAAVLPMRKKLSNEVGANLLSNPNTALAIIHYFKQLGVSTFIQSAGASDVGQLLQAAALENRMHVINIVRREDHAELLRSKFGFPALNSNSPAFDEELEAASRAYKPAVYLDAVSGKLTARVSRALAPGGRIVLYGMLSGQEPAIERKLFFQKNLRLETFSIMRWWAEQSLAGMLRHALQLQSFAGKHAGSTILGVVGLQQLTEEWREYEKQAGQGKFLLDPFK